MICLFFYLICYYVLKRLPIILVITLIPLIGLLAQSVENLKVKLDGREIVVYFDLVSPNSNGFYSIDLFSSNDNYNMPLKIVSGDVGIEIAPGNEKRITWRAKDEIGGYKGKISIEIRARFYIPFVKVQSPVTNQMLRRGKVSSLEWTEGTATDELRLELYKDNQRLQTISTTPNTGLYRWSVPGNIKAGKNYQIRLSDLKNQEDAVFTGEFRIGQKIPMGLKIGVGVLVGAAVYFLIPKDTEPPVVLETIPNPPPVPGN